MEKKVKTTEFKIVDDYGKTLDDSVNARSKKRNSPEGYVEIYDVQPDGTKQLVGRHNLILYQGREWVAQRILNQNNSFVTSDKDEFITWFGLGNGGVILGDPLSPQPPVLTDTELSSLVMINATDSSAADHHVIDADHPEIGYYKIPFDTIEFEQDALNDDKWLVLKISTTVGVDDANGYQLSEAGLYTASSSAGQYSGQFTLFARVTYPSIVKTSDRRLIYSWFLYV